ncbi:uncharacterized protein UTRI_10304 [Ustilago trichophora]|uniref:Uncharacterized protein n=2 Tax=Ustilago trichophora TaxID=86804 RepID=A0A5C3ECX9_9BASI|nr:uncharacterized protein UTRI_00928 [Ustilago trichophora]SPO26595.1 uncharacterized protein UTRI_04184 [Ustilago trichophora]SPO28534.1 uncharacterized protein UTRI_04931 [Ustilago trichophora]SPO28535.1 uncharacterized protein UTRI_00928_B [Ustilago trichophora]SPO30193.1 uncharacterized protein UTRI_06032 [Ustilago trichophora]
MPTNKQKAHNKRLKDQRARINAAKEYPDTLYLEKVGEQEEYHLVGQPHAVEGMAEPVKVNLTLLDAETEEPIFQRISPTSLDKQLAANKSAKEGLELYERAQTHHREDQSRGHMHLGFWSEMGNPKYNMSRHTTHNQHALPLLNWARKHSDLYLSTLYPLIHEDWQAHLDTRKDSMAWLRDFMQDQVAVLPDWWSTCTFFNTTTPGVHQDQKDQIPSFLFNFGAPTIVRLRDYGVDIQLDHLDVVIFNTSNFHSTYSPDQDLQGRWAFSAFMRKVFYEKQPPHNLSQARIDSEVEEPTWRIRGANV